MKIMLNRLGMTITLNRLINPKLPMNNEKKPTNITKKNTLTVKNNDFLFKRMIMNIDET